MSDDLSGCWKRLVATDVVFKAIAFALLTPLLGVLFRVLLAVSGDSFLADQDILLFLLGPFGWACALLAGGVWLAIVALEQAALLGVLAGKRNAGAYGVVESLRFAGRHALPVLKVTVRMVAFTLLAIVPWLAAIGLLYGAMLTEHDINFYLKEKPPEFLVAVALASLATLTLAAVLLRLFTGWFLALPVVLFEDASPSTALRSSNARIQGNRASALTRIGLWLLLTTVLSAAGSGGGVGLGRIVVPLAAESLALLPLVIGALLLAWIALGLITNLLSTVTFALMLIATYEDLGGDARLDASPPDVATPARVGFGLTMPRAVAFALAGLVLATAAGASLIRTVRADQDVAVIAHRGASASAPENTLAAIRVAIEEGADWVEIDVQETADGEVAVFHDSDFMKLAGNPLKIWDATAADLAAIDIGSSFSPDFRNERVPLLADVLRLCKGRVKVLIELKYYGHDDRLEQRVLDLVAKHDMQREVSYMSLKAPAVEKLKAMAPGAQVGVLLSVSAGDLKKLPADFLAINGQFVDRRTVKQAHGRDHLVYVWTINDALTMSRMIGRGVDGLITDHPALARSVIQERSELNPTQRLLLELADLFGLKHKVADQ